jgi:hypothetical protein
MGVLWRLLYCLSEPTFAKTVVPPGYEAADRQFLPDLGASNQPSASTSVLSHAQSETIVWGAYRSSGVSITSLTVP